MPHYHSFFIPNAKFSSMIQLLPPANEVWGKVMLSQVFVCPQWGKGVCLGDRYPGGLPGRGSAYMGGVLMGGGR